MTTDHTPPTDQTADQTALRDRIAEAIADAMKPRYGGPQHNTSGGLPLTATPEEARLHRAKPLADAVLAVLPPPTDRAAFQVRAIDLLARARDIHRETCILARGDVQPSAYRCGMCEVLNAPAVEPPADQTALRQRIADAVQPLLMDTLPQTIASARAQEAADVVLAVLPPPVPGADEIEHLQDRLTSCRERVGIAADKAIAAEDVIERARKARRRITSALLAVESFLNKPYPDDPRWTPWTRFVGPALKELSDALTEPAAGLRRMADETQPAKPLTEVWVVWREDEAAYGYFATEDTAKQATIDCWEEDEPVCPDYSWRRDGPRWELVVGGEHGGVYASRHRVYGTPADEDAQRTARRRNSILNLLDRLDRHGTLTPEERALLRNHVVDEGLEHDTACARAEQAEERAERAAKRTEEHRRLAAHRLTELEQAQARVRLLTADIDGCTAQQWPQRLAAAEATIKRVRAVARDWGPTLLPHSEAHRLLTDLRKALDGTEPAPAATEATEQP